MVTERSSVVSVARGVLTTAFVGFFGAAAEVGLSEPDFLSLAGADVLAFLLHGYRFHLESLPRVRADQARAGRGESVHKGDAQASKRSFQIPPCGLLGQRPSRAVWTIVTRCSR